MFDDNDSSYELSYLFQMKADTTFETNTGVRRDFTRRKYDRKKERKTKSELEKKNDLV